MMSPQSHMKNIIWYPDLMSNHIFLSNSLGNNAIQFTSFLEMFDKFLVSKKRPFRFCKIISSKSPKTRAYRLPEGESNVATVVAMNQRRDNLFLNSELLLLHHYGCSFSNEYILPVIIRV